ncbi:NAD(P)-dependent oxidoreductase [Bradyrhizobium sp. dw_411]|uniref:NAD-dependent epimerase/dehydratase family protein n=1 Tax=Bradyrhizobium sp. dw_411 TaxID=2720082 RepID=UPI001BCCE375|nr:NAD(P)-dependent oxidoreductase [Bradyrhizobium sp. dw_411]
MTGDTILVTGVSGLIGGAVARRLSLAGRRIVASDIVPLTERDYPVVEHDLGDQARWLDIIDRFGVSKVVHAGGISGPMLLQGQPARICEINLQGLTGLLEAARVRGLARIVWFSSITAYGNRPDLAPVDEETPLHPTTIYAATKAAGEALLAGYFHEYGVDSVALRVASCYGPGRTSACLIRTIVEDALAGRTTRVRQTRESRQHIFIEDVADAVIAALDKKTLSQRVFNIGPGRMQSLDEIVAGICEVVPAAKVELHDDGLAWNTFGIGPMKVDAARNHLGFEPRTTIAHGAQQTRLWLEQRNLT